MDHPNWWNGWPRLPSRLKIRGQEGKFLLKKAMEPHLPHDVLYRPKMGFLGALARWFRGPLRSACATRCSARAGGTGWFNRITSSTWSTPTSRARATTARRCGRC
jgi:asparagine synthase (glutamine-hydrolysing)